MVDEEVVKRLIDEADFDWDSSVDTYVQCMKCGCPGARSNANPADIFWPAT